MTQILCSCGADLRAVPFVELQNHDRHSLVSEILEFRAAPKNLGPLNDGHYVQVGLGFGFYVPESDYQELQRLANTTGRIQFLGITRDGNPLYGSRDAITAHPDSAGCIAWIVPK